MDRFRTLNPIQVEPDQCSQDNGVVEETPTAETWPSATVAGDEEENADEDGGMRFMGMKVVRRRALTEKDCGGDYVGVDSDKHLSKILSKQGLYRLFQTKQTIS
jgi:hypothetical protein